MAKSIPSSIAAIMTACFGINKGGTPPILKPKMLFLSEKLKWQYSWADERKHYLLSGG
jgi:hypothetical protein